MEELHQCFEASRKRIGLTSRYAPVFYNAAASLRFEIGGDEEIYLADHRMPNGAYVENALDRAMAIYRQLPAAPDILRLETFYRQKDRPYVSQRMLTNLGLPQPDLLVPGQKEPEHQEDSPCFYYWNLEKGAPFLRKLLREIILGEISPQGLDWLCSSVYFLDSRHDILYHLYDDRGCDVVAPEKTLLEPLYREFNQWILDYDREQIDRLFQK